MILQISTRDDESSLLPDERRRGDVFAVHPDSFTPGGIERVTWFFVKVPDPPLLSKWQAALVRSRYGQPATAGSDPPVTLFREWKLEYWLTLSESLVEIIDKNNDADESTPGFQAVAGDNYLEDGPAAGGTVANFGVLDGVFDVSDLRLK